LPTDADCIAVAKHCGRHGRPYIFVTLVDLGVSSSPRKNLRQSADYRKSGILPVVIARLEACRPRVAAATKAILQSKCRTSINMARGIVHLRLYRAKKITTLFGRS
jgi:hypothetical protein